MENSRIIRTLSGVAGVLLMICMLAACGDSHEIVIRGDLRGANTFLEGKKLYFGNAETRYFVDTAVVREGKFEFRVKTDDGFVPFRAAIVFETGNSAWPHQLVGYENPYSTKIDEPNFYAEPGLMQLELDTIQQFGKEKNVVSFRVRELNRQTAVAFHHYTFKNDVEKSDDNRDYNRSIIQKHPYSLELLRTLNFSKSSLDNNEAKNLLTLFDPELHSNPGYLALKAYFDYDNKTGSDFPTEVALQTADDKSVKEILVDSSKHNLIVFWASWCGPCRMEIPQIKKLYENESRKLNVVSISVDRDQTAWKKAMEKEQMPWKQFLLPEGETYAVLDKKYNLQVIPIWVLLDGSGKVVDQHVGYDPGKNAVDLKVAALLK